LGKAMITDYDPIAEQYRRAKQQPRRAYVEAYSLLELIGDVRAKSVADLACGEGFYTRLVRQLGAGKVVGVDLSEGMIALARGQEARQQLGIDYQVGDAKRPQLAAAHDLVIAA